MEAFLRQTWVDPRLNYEHLSNFSNLELDQRMMGDVWVPDTYFPNEKEAHFHVVTVPNRLLHINRNGTVFYSIRWVSFKVKGAEASILCFQVFVDLLLKDANNLIFHGAYFKNCYIQLSLYLHIFLLQVVFNIDLSDELV